MQWQIQSYETIDSTNLEAKRKIQQSPLGASLHGTVIVAEEQTQGKGRLGRQWDSNRAEGLWFSAIRLSLLRPEQASLYSFAAAVAVAEAMNAQTGLSVQLKWPNDVLAEGKKLCGILLELVPRTKTEYDIVIGIGLNVNQKKQAFSDALQDKATSLALLTAQEWDRTHLLMSILDKLQENCELLEREGFLPLREKWKAMSNLLGRAVSVQQNGTELYSGIAEDLALDGTLLVRSNGELRAVCAADISLRTKQGEYSF